MRLAAPLLLRWAGSLCFCLCSPPPPPQLLPSPNYPFLSCRSVLSGTVATSCLSLLKLKLESIPRSRWLLHWTKKIPAFPASQTVQPDSALVDGPGYKGKEGPHGKLSISSDGGREGKSRGQRFLGHRPGKEPRPAARTGSHWKDVSSEELNGSILLAHSFKHSSLISCPDYVLVAYLLSAEWWTDYSTCLNIHVSHIKGGTDRMYHNKL